MECYNEINRYEYEGKCYDTCPGIAPLYIISKESERTTFNCVSKCPFEYPFDIIETHNCVKSCNLIERENKIFRINYFSDDTNNKEVEDISMKEKI